MKGTVTIAGGGLAGLSLARGLRLRGISVELHEAGSYPRHRVCGEFISGVSTETLVALGIGDAIREARPLESFAWFSQGRLFHRGWLDEAAHGISRHRLDAWLRDAARDAGAVVHEGSRLARSPNEGLVWAAGRIPCPAAESRWLGLKCHFTGLAMDHDLEMHLGGNGYAGLARIEGGRVNLCALFRTDRAMAGKQIELLHAYLRAGGHHALADRLLTAEADPASFCATTGFALGRQALVPELCAIGDAESMIPPFTGNGMSMAFQAAERAMEPLQHWSEGRISWESCVASVRGKLRHGFRRRLAAASFIHPLLLRAGGRRFIESLGSSGLLPFRSLLALVR